MHQKMLALVLSTLVALNQAAPAKNPVKCRDDGPSDIPANLLRDLKTAKAFAKHVTGPPDILANWTASGDDLCSWKGFYCDTNPDTNVWSLASIEFNDFELDGKLRLTGFLDKFPDLALFHINTNSFSGQVPDISQMQYLYEIDLSNNQFSGPFPQNLLRANKLAFIDLRYNEFSGPIPGNVFTAYPDLEVLLLNNNKFSGQIPNEIGAFPGFDILLMNNHLSGHIPDTLGNARSLEQFSAAGNKLSGSIPGSIGYLTNLTYFDVSENKLTGTIPETLCASKSLQVLNVTGNRLSSDLGPMCQASKANGILLM